MRDSHLQLRSIRLRGPKAEAQLEFHSGVNVICGASDTRRSLLADSIDFMLDGSALKEIPGRAKYDQLDLSLGATRTRSTLMKHMMAPSLLRRRRKSKKSSASRQN